jgi:hypothetical protein
MEMTETEMSNLIVPTIELRKRKEEKDCKRWCPDCPLDIEPL